MSALRAEEGATPTQRRSVARLRAVQALYQMEMSGSSATTTIADFQSQRMPRETDAAEAAALDAEFFGDLVAGVARHLPGIDAALARALSARWNLVRIEHLVRACLRAGTYELMARPDVPARVVITEYVDVAHAFFAGAEPGFINGVLDRVGRELRAPEFVTRPNDAALEAR